MSKAPSLCYNDSERRWAKRYHDRRFNQRNYVNPAPWNNTVKTVDVPDDAERVDHDGSPCFMCGVRADIACRHRPWMVAS